MNAADLLGDLAHLGIEVVAHEDRLRYRPRSAVTPALADRMKSHKTELLAILRTAEAFGVPTAATMVDHPNRVESRPEVEPEAIRWEDTIDPPEPCPKCDSLELWQTLAGNWRCLRCDPPTTALRLLERTEEVRRRHGIPSPAGTVEMLGEMKRLTTT